MVTWTHELTDDYQATTVSGTGKTWTISAGTTGDLRIIRFHTEAGSSIHVSSLSGGGVTTWARAGSTNSSSGSGGVIEYWYGPITGSGTSLSITYSGSVGGNSARMYRADFRCSSPLSALTVENTGYTDKTSNVTTITWPTVTAGSVGTQLAVGFAWSGSTPSTGSTSGYTYALDSSGNVNLYNTTVAASSNQAPTAPQTSGEYSAELVIFSNNVSTSASAGVATVTAAAQGITATLIPGAAAGRAAATAAANNASVHISPTAGVAQATAAAYTAVYGRLGKSASATAAAQGASVRIGPTAGVAQATAAGKAAIAGIGAIAVVATATAASPSSLALLPTLASPMRRYVVNSDNRLLMVPSDSRTIVVPIEIRTMTAMS